jgi:hypothetical protein
LLPKDAERNAAAVLGKANLVPRALVQTPGGAKWSIPQIRVGLSNGDGPLK